MKLSWEFDKMASYQYVYVMKDLTKAFPGGREVFKGITLSFLPGVKIGDGAITGAGSVITKDVEANALAVTRSEQKQIPGWAEKFRARKKAEKAAKDPNKLR